MGNSKNKGNTFERAICKELSLWWSNGTNDNVFWRTASSGGRATQRGKKGKTTSNQGGDITFTDAVGEPFISMFSIEVKKGYPSYELQRILDKSENTKPSILEQWIQQAKKSHESARSHSWALIAKKDRAQTLIYLPHRDYLTCTEGKYPKQNYVIIGNLLTTNEQLEEKTEKSTEPAKPSGIICMPLQAFFDTAKPDAIKKSATLKGFLFDGVY